MPEEFLAKDRFQQAYEVPLTGMPTEFAGGIIEGSGPLADRMRAMQAKRVE